MIADPSDAADTIALVERAGSEALGVRCDLSSAQDVARLADEARSRFHAGRGGFSHYAASKGGLIKQAQEPSTSPGRRPP